jgi:uncharacterized phage infection (PIP) family protein YhgE
MDICCNEIKVNSQVISAEKKGTTEKNTENKDSEGIPEKEAPASNQDILHLRENMKGLQDQINKITEKYNDILRQDSNNRQYQISHEIHRNELKKKY